jgi:hypothetical protein
MFTKLCNMKAFPCFTELLRHLDLNEWLNGKLRTIVLRNIFGFSFPYLLQTLMDPNHGSPRKQTMKCQTRYIYIWQYLLLLLLCGLLIPLQWFYLITYGIDSNVPHIHVATFSLNMIYSNMECTGLSHKKHLPYHCTQNCSNWNIKLYWTWLGCHSQLIRLHSTCANFLLWSVAAKIMKAATKATLEKQ